jgi:hypothetical protein
VSKFEGIDLNMILGDGVSKAPEVVPAEEPVAVPADAAAAGAPAPAAPVAPVAPPAPPLPSSFASQ